MFFQIFDVKVVIKRNFILSLISFFSLHVLSRINWAEFYYKISAKTKKQNLDLCIKFSINYTRLEISWVYLVIHAMYLRNSDHILTMKSTFIFLMSFAILLAFVSIGSVYAQNQSQSQNQSSMVPENQTMATVSDSPQTVLANQTTVPAEQTTVTVNQTTEPIQNQSQLQPLGNQTLTSETGDLSNIENKTMVQATGPATTVIANKTTVPFNQTSIGTGNTTD